MLRESIHFHFAGRKSTDFGIKNVNFSEGLFDEQVVSDKSINEVKIRGRKKPYFIDVEEEPKNIELRFSFLDTWDDELIDDVIQWLNVDTYQPLYFETDVDKVFYAMPVEGVRVIHNGLKDGYLELNMRCNSSVSYSHDNVTKEYNTSELAEKQGVDNPEIIIANKGHFTMFPEIWIEKIDDGDITIHNKTNGNAKFEFKDIEKDEKLYIDCENEIIETSEEDTHRYDNFNDKFLCLLYGKNRLTVSNNVKIRFKYQYMFL